jgi:hypothetical protein
MKITEGTLIPISLVIVIIGGVSWLTTIHAGERRNSESITEIKAHAKEFSDNVGEKIDILLERTARIEEQIKKIGDQ